jgi:hypothetical protein
MTNKIITNTKTNIVNKNDFEDHEEYDDENFKFSIIEEYKKLNELCDLVLNKINNRRIVRDLK